MSTLKATLAAILATGMLAACAGPQPSHYYTLLPTAADNIRAGGNPAPKYAVIVDPVNLPEQVDRPQIILTDPQSAQVVPLNSSLWASPLRDELRRAVADDLYRRLGVLDLASTGLPDGLPAWRLFLDIQRFESLYNQQALIDASWQLTPVNQRGKKAVICRAQASVAVGEGMSSLVEGHRQALQLLSGLISTQLQTGRLPVAQDERIQFKGCTGSPVK